MGRAKVITVLGYLNDVRVGGGTNFSKLDITVNPKPGRVVIFHNTNENILGPHPKSLHAGMPVLDGEKWAFNVWFRHLPMKEQYIHPKEENK